MRDLLNTTGFRGALGDFPEGQLTKTDEGAIQFAIGEKDGKVVIDFGTPVHWLGMTPQQAADFASAIIKRAREAARKNGKTVGFTIG
jgi:O-acetyl-ADP-ribose deacetylase (regulator of RNase III)